MPRYHAPSRFLNLPENRSAVKAVVDVRRHLLAERGSRVAVPVYIHGPTGVGKSHLIASLVREVCRDGGAVVASLTASEFDLAISQENRAADILDQAKLSDLWILEDIHHLPAGAFETLVQILDRRASRRLCTIVTSVVGPRNLKTRAQPFPMRLVSRLSAGLVVAIEPLQAASRLVLLEEWAQRRQFAIDPAILRWLADSLPGSGRILEGAMHQLEALATHQRKAPDLAQVEKHFRTQAEAHEPTVDRIVELVSGYFRLEPGALRSRRRVRNIVLPRQVSMYLARKLTALSLEEIGRLFGGRDHTTVLHACRKVEEALPDDAMLSGAVRQLHSQLA